MNSATIVVKKPGLFVPESLLSTVSTRCPTAFGFAGREKGILRCEIADTPISVEELGKLQEAFKDEHLVMYFANFPKAVIPDDVQPWSVRVPDENGEHIVMLFGEGDFGSYSGMNGDHTDASNAFDEVVFPRLSRAMNDADQNVDRFFDELRKPNFQKTLTNAFKDRGYFVLFPVKGDPICFGNVPNGLLDQPWGLVSNAHGWTPPVAKAPETIAEPKPALAFLRGGGVSVPTAKATKDIPVSVTTKEPAPIPEPEPSGGEGLPLKPGKENEQVGINPAIVGKSEKELEAAGWRKTFPPPKLAKGKARNFWLRVFNGGKLPPDHESSQCAVWVSPDIIDLSNRTASSKGEVENIAYQVNKRRKEAAGSGDVISKQMAIASQSAEILTSKEEKPITSGKSTVRERYVGNEGTPGNGTSMFTPDMSDDDTLKAMERLDGYLDPKNRKRPTPTEIYEGEKKWPTFSERTGRKFTDLLFLPVAQITDLFDGNKIATSAFIEMRTKFIQASRLDLSALVLSGQEVPDDVRDVNDRTKEKKEEPAQKASVPAVPAQSGGLAFLRKTG